MEAGAYDAVVSNHWAEGGKGAEALGRAVIAACSASKSEDFKYLYDLELPIREKVEIISKEIYGADGVDFSDVAEQQIILLRDSNKKLCAFANVCRHRGARLLDGQGNCKGLRCPFHSWFYGLDGKLIAAPHMEKIKDFDNSSKRT